MIQREWHGITPVAQFKFGLKPDKDEKSSNQRNITARSANSRINTLAASMYSTYIAMPVSISYSRWGSEGAYPTGAHRCPGSDSQHVHSQ